MHLSISLIPLVATLSIALPTAPSQLFERGPLPICTPKNARSGKSTDAKSCINFLRTQAALGVMCEFKASEDQVFFCYQDHYIEGGPWTGIAATRKIEEQLGISAESLRDRSVSCDLVADAAQSILDSCTNDNCAEPEKNGCGVDGWAHVGEGRNAMQISVFGAMNWDN